MNPIDKYHQEQIKLLKELFIPDGENGYFPSSGDLVFSIDIQYEGDDGYVAVDVSEWQGIESQVVYVNKEPITEEYYPGYFAFREGPLIVKTIDKVIAHLKRRPDLLILDGHGTAHPRKLGLASWMGIRMDTPAIGVAKRSLLKFPFQLGEVAGSFMEIKDAEETIGYVYRSQTGINPIFISSGHKISQKNSLNVTSQLTGKYRIIEPIRRADQAARKFAKGIVENGKVEL